MTDPNWRNFWGAYRRRDVTSDADLFYEVGRTENGVPMTPERFERVIERVRFGLELDSGDDVYEVCCGNGLVTRAISPMVRSIVAVDFAEHLIAHARIQSPRPNVTYRVGDALDSPDEHFHGGRVPRKWLMADALAYFDTDGLGRWLDLFSRFIPSGAAIAMATGVPDESRKFEFYDTEERRARYLATASDPQATNDGVGRFWKREEIERLALERGLDADVIDQPLDLSRFRFDVVFRR